MASPSNPSNDADADKPEPSPAALLEDLSAMEGNGDVATLQPANRANGLKSEEEVLEMDEMGNEVGSSGSSEGPAPADAQPSPKLETPAKVEMTWPLLLLFALAAGVAVMQLYNSQPLLSTVETVFNVSTSTAGSIPALVQGGYSLTLILVTPLADILPRKQLVIFLYCLCIACTLGLAFVPNIIGFQILNFFIGFTTCSGQILMPLAAELSPPNRMGTNMAILSTSMTLAVLVARLIAGVIADTLGFRAVYYFAAGIQAVVISLFAFFCPRVAHERQGKESYLQLLKSLFVILFTDQILQQSAAIALFCFASFTSFWTTSSFLLANAPYNYADSTIGLLALPGAAGVVLAPFIGRLGDKIGPFNIIFVGVILLLIAWVQCLIFGSWAAGSVFFAAFLLDFGVQVQQVMNQMRIFGTPRPGAEGKRSRLNGIYMLVGYSGTFIGSAVGTACYVNWKWHGAGGAGVGFAIAAAATWLIGGPGGRPRWMGGEKWMPDGLTTMGRLKFWVWPPKNWNVQPEVVQGDQVTVERGKR